MQGSAMWPACTIICASLLNTMTYTQTHTCIIINLKYAPALSDHQQLDSSFISVCVCVCPSIRPYKCLHVYLHVYLSKWVCARHHRLTIICSWNCNHSGDSTASSLKYNSSSKTSFHRCHFRWLLSTLMFKHVRIYWINQHFEGEIQPRFIPYQQIPCPIDNFTKTLFTPYLH